VFSHVSYNSAFWDSIQSFLDQSIFTPWRPLSTFREMPEMYQPGGIYRVRAQGEDICMYIGVTDCRLRDPLENLSRSLRQDTVPGHVPHTAGTHLWWRMRQNIRYEISVAPLPSLMPDARLIMKSLALALHRQEYQASPLANYGRLPASSQQELSTLSPPVYFSPQKFQPGAPPLGPLKSFGEYDSRCWGHSIWTPWVPLVQVQRSLPLKPSDRGFFRLRLRRGGIPVFIGYGAIYASLLAQAFRQKGARLTDIECSWVTSSLPNHIGRERLDDLVAGLLLQFHHHPRVQSAQCRIMPGLQDAEWVSHWIARPA
jgi:hypothetical protein